MDSLKFERCRDFALPNIDVKTPTYLDLAQNFQEALERIRCMAALPAEVNYWSGLIVGQLILAQRQLRKLSVDAEVRELANQEMKKWIERRTSVLGSDPEVLREHQWTEGIENFNSLMESDESGEFRQGAETALAAMITSAWAAFEALSIDLWVAAVNKHSLTLGVRAAEKNGDKQISLRELSGRKLDLKSSMGDFLYGAKKVSLETFDNVKKAYLSAFGEDWSGVFDAFPQLNTAEQLRHLFAHRSGRVDQRFLDRNAGNPELIDIAVGQRFRVDGIITSKCVDVCSKCGVELLKFVDDWSDAHARDAL